MPTTHKPASPQSVFRFVSVRAPRKLSADAEAKRFCKYDADHPSTFVQALIAIKADTNLDENNKLVQIQTAAKSFKERTDAFITQASLQVSGTEVLRFAEYLSTHRDSIKHENIPTDLSTSYVLSSSLLTQLWDTLIAMAIVGGSPEIREQLLQLIRLQYFIGKYQTTLSEKELRMLAHIQVTLPNSVFPLPQEKFISPTPPVENNEPHPLEVLQDVLNAKNDAKQMLEKL